MTSNIPWFKLALIGTFIGVSAIIGYVATTSFTNGQDSEVVETIPNTSEEKAKKMKKKRKARSLKAGSGISKSSSATSTTSVKDPFEVAMEFIEKDVSILNKLSPELKQQVFYILLIRGETLIKEDRSGSSIEKAVEYFVKAVALVSSPAEVLMSYEQTLPTEIFKKIIASLQNQNLEKTKVYFESLKPATGMIKFEELAGQKAVGPTGKSEATQWMAVAEGSIEEGAVLMSEEPDIAICVTENCCDYCFKSLDGEVEKFYISDLVYCSGYCRVQAKSTYGKYIEELEGTPAYAYQQLIKVVQETKSYSPILMLRYIASLLEDELNRQKLNDSEKPSSSVNLFAHYDYLRPAYRVPRDSDKAEAVLIRTILEPSHSEISQFLSDEIYVAMKSTVMFNSIGLPIQPSSNSDGFLEGSKIDVNNTKDDDDQVDGSKPILKPVEPIRVSGTVSNSKFIGLYHSFAHISHSCSANCELVSDESVPRRLKLISKRAIKENELISISYSSSNASSCKKDIIERDFYISCDCN